MRALQIEEGETLPLVLTRYPTSVWMAAYQLLYRSNVTEVIHVVDGVYGMNRLASIENAKSLAYVLVSCFLYLLSRWWCGETWHTISRRR